MRTTLEIEDDVLEVAKDVARHQCLSLGKAVSLLIRKGIQGPQKKEMHRNGLRVVTRSQDASPVTLEIVNQIRDEG
ncbi:MAG: CopG family transcriptional regulator [Verrucomicrobia bacterium]|nr:CopG family transcriptional regulator [Verrucomicrobiota bacterium]